MAVLKTAQVAVGMELAEAATNIRGVILFKAGTVLTQKHIKALKAWGITELDVQDDNTAPAGPEQVQVSQTTEVLTPNTDIEEEVYFIFQKTDMEDPVIKELYRLSIETRASCTSLTRYSGESMRPRLRMYSRLGELSTVSLTQ